MGLKPRQKSGFKAFIGSYPITPATGSSKNWLPQGLGVKSFQARMRSPEFVPHLAQASQQFGVTSTSGPGMALKSEAIDCSNDRIPVVIINVQRGGPHRSANKTEQLIFAGSLCRNGNACVLCIQHSSDCFHFAFEAARIAWNI